MRRRVSVQNLSTTSHHQLSSNIYRRQGVELYFFSKDVPVFWTIWWDNTDSTHQKKNQHLSTLPFRAGWEIFHLSIFLNFSKKATWKYWVGCRRGP